MVVGLYVWGCVVVRVVGDVVVWLVLLGVEGDGDVGLGVDGKFDWVCVCYLVVGDDDGGGVVVEGEGFECCGVDVGYFGFVFGGEGDGGGGDGEVVVVEGVVDLDVEFFGVDGEVEGLFDGGIVEDVFVGLWNDCVSLGWIVILKRNIWIVKVVYC